MGVCLSKQGDRTAYEENRSIILRNREINDLILRENKLQDNTNHNTLKLLILGAADSGKSTVLKQAYYWFDLR